MVTVPFTLAAVGFAAIWDFNTNRIPNFITLPSIAIGLALNTYLNGFSGFIAAAAGLLTGLGLFLIPYVLGGMGAGDVKLLATIGALNGTQLVINTFLYGAIAGGVIALCLLLIRGKQQIVLFNVFWIFQTLFDRQSTSSIRESSSIATSGIRFPYGIAIFLGIAAAYYLG